MSFDKFDDFGKSPFPDLNSLTEDELEYVRQNLDSLLAADDAKLIGVLKEFWEQNINFNKF